MLDIKLKSPKHNALVKDIVVLLLKKMLPMNWKLHVLVKVMLYNFSILTLDLVQNTRNAWCTMFHAIPTTFPLTPMSK